MKRGFVWVLMLAGMAAMAFGAGVKQPAATAPSAVTAEASAFDMKVWATPAEFQRETGQRIATYREAPQLAPLVSRGTLPAVTQRLPAEPLVVQAFGDIGRYGGTIRAVAPSRAAWNDVILSFLLDDAMLLSNDTGDILINYARSYSISEDHRTYTLRLREGLKWSDGHPFTVDDILFWWESDMTKSDVTPVVWAAWRSGGEPLRFEKVDDLTLRITAKEPYPAFLFALSQYSSHQARMFHPKHYLKKWHIDHNPDANALAKSEGFETWVQAFVFHRQFEPFANDPNLPTISAWRLKSIDTSRAVYERNPYYWKVDTAGNQLPYVDEVVVEFVATPETINLKTIAGDFDYACLELALKNYPLYKENEDKGGYRVMDWQSTEGNWATYSFNLNHPDEGLRKLFQDVRFRRAMSLAVDREAINETVFFGLGKARQTTVLPVASFYKPEWGAAYASFDKAQANRLLDEIGLDRRDREGFRLRPDGRALSITINVHNIGSYLPITEMVAEFWNAVGVKTSIREVSWDLFFTRREALEFDVDVWHLGLAMEGSLYSNPRRFSPMWGENSVAPAWGRWLDTGGKEGQEPPAAVKELASWLDAWRTVDRTDPRYKQYAQRIYDNYAENVWTIGTVGITKLPVVVNERLRNVPNNGYHGNDNGFARNFQPWQWYYAAE